MPERLILLSIGPSAKELQIVRIISQIHQLNADEIRKRLARLPWLLPEIGDYEQLEAIQEKLERLGCGVERKFIELPPRPAEPKISEKKLKEAPAPGTPPLRRREGAVTAAFEKRPAGRPEISRSTSELDIRSTVPSRKPRWPPYFFLFLFLGFAAFLWLGTLKGKTAVKSGEKSDEKGGYSSKLAAGRTPSSDGPQDDGSTDNGQAAVPPGVAAIAEQQAQAWYQAAMEDPNPEKKAAKLERSLERNPYQTSAWQQLIMTLEASGRIEEAKEARRRAWEQNEKVRMVLKSIADRFGDTYVPLNLSPGRFYFDIRISMENAEKIRESGYRLYRFVSKIHKDKKISATFRAEGGAAYRVDVPPQENVLDRETFKQFFQKEE